jgi:hypothetical protein
MRPTVVRIWFNRHFSTIGRVLHHLRSAPDPLPIWTCVSHRHFHFTGFALADLALLEPADLSAPDYLAWCLETVQSLAITHLVPGHEQSYITAHAHRFEAIGCTVVNAAPPGILPNLHRKDWVYQQLSGAIPLPVYEVAASVDEALVAIARLQQSGEVCVKPCVSVYGKGFFRLVEESPERTDADTVAGWEVRVRSKARFDPHLVMQYLPGAEYSVDIAARHGTLLAAVIRRKDESRNIQVLLDQPDLIAYSAAMIERFQANGLINIQFKEDAEGIARLLEINPRASGGIGMSCMSGINLPDVAYRAALFPQLPLITPTGRTGIRVAEISLAVEVPMPQAPTSQGA